MSGVGGGVEPFECRLGVAGRTYPLGVVDVVGGHVQHAAGLQSRGDELERPRLKQAPLVVACLGPGVREEHPDAGEAGRCDHVGEHVHAVAADHANVLQVLAQDHPEQLGQAGLVDLHRDHVDVRLDGRHRGGRGAGAGADLHDQRRGAAEESLWVHPVVGDVPAVGGPVVVPVALLSRAHGAASEPVGGHPGEESGVVIRGRASGLGGVLALVHPAIIP